MKIEASLPPAPPLKAIEKSEPEDKTYGLGAVLKQFRERRGFTQKDVADAVGLERTSITNIERGNQLLTLQNLIRICEALDAELKISITPRERL